MNILSALEEIFRDVFDDKALVLTKETSAEDIEDWDSLAQINIIAACEAEFGIKFDLNEIVNINSVGDLLDIIEGKLG